MAHWLEKIVVILKAETGNLRDLAKLAGGDPKTFYLGVDVNKIDFRGQNIEGMQFSGASPRSPQDAINLQALESLQRDLLRATERSKRVSEHTANISHEIRGPLTTVLGMADLMLTDPAITEQQRERLQIILTAGDTLRRLTDEVVNWDWDSETRDLTRRANDNPV